MLISCVGSGFACCHGGGADTDGGDDKKAGMRWKVPAAESAGSFRRCV